ncbi:MAG TPA: hypothetical protein VF630_04330 [Hymenobacter sp.]
MRIVVLHAFGNQAQDGFAAQGPPTFGTELCFEAALIQRLKAKHPPHARQLAGRVGESYGGAHHGAAVKRVPQPGPHQ